MRTKIFKLANFLHYQKGLTRSEALRKAWKVIRLKEAMKADQVEFTFTQKRRQPTPRNRNPPERRRISKDQRNWKTLPY
jgi:hypothetical protein